jgi:Ca-activated chloride channel family protein
MAVLSFAVYAAPTGSQEQEQQEQEQKDRYQFRVTVDLISLNVTVTDARSRFVTELLQKDFAVYEDGISQEISVFSREDLPIRLLLLLDTSASMDEKMSFAQEAAVNFVGTMKEDDLTEVMEFGSKPHVLQPFTGDTEKLSRAIRMTQAGGTTSLYNALYIALRA